MSQQFTLVLVILVIKCIPTARGDVKIRTSSDFECFNDICSYGQYCDNIETRCSPCPCTVCDLKQPIQCQIYCKALKEYHKTPELPLSEPADRSDDSSNSYYQFLLNLAVNIAVFLMVFVLLILNIKNNSITLAAREKATNCLKLSTNQCGDSAEIKKLTSDQFSDKFVSDTVTSSSNSLGYSPRYVYKTPQLCQDELITTESRPVMEMGDNNITYPAEESQGCQIWTMSQTTQPIITNNSRSDIEHSMEETVAKTNVDV